MNTYNEYFKEFNRLAVGKYADLSYGNPNPNPTAAALESLIAYSNYIGDSNATILDSGAGASTWMIRQMFNNVVTNEPNKHYLEFIEHLCKENGIKGGGFYLGWDGIEKVDHCFYDYGDSERYPNLIHAIELTNKSIYVDDTNYRPECADYKKLTIDLCNKLGLKYFYLEDVNETSTRGGLIIEK